MTSSKRIQIRCTEDQFNFINRVATARSMTMTDMMLKLVTNWCEQVEQAETAKVKAQEAKELAAQQDKHERVMAGLTRSQRAQVMAKGFYLDEDGDEVMI